MVNICENGIRLSKEAIGLSERPLGEFGPDKLVLPDHELGLSNLLALLKDGMSKEYKGKMSAVILSSDGDPIESLVPSCDDEFALTSERQPEFTAVRLTRAYLEKKSGEAVQMSGTFFIIPMGSGLWSSVTIEPDEFIEKVMMKYIGLCSPDVSIVRYSSTELKNILATLAEGDELDVEIRKAITYPYGGSASIDFDNKPLSRLIDYCLAERRYLDKARLELRRDGASVCDLFISRQGLLRFYSGNVEFFFNHVLSSFAGLARETKKVLDEKERSLGELEAHPIAIEFDGDAFTSVDDNYRFAKALSTIGKSGISIYHLNPYVHISYLDFRDGSSCDVFAVSSREVCIVPSYKSSMESLMRLSAKIMESLGEGHITDWARGAPKFSDFFE